MGKGKIIYFGFNKGLQLFEAELVQYGKKGFGIDNHLKNIAANQGLVSLSSPMVGECWKALVILKKQYLKANKWRGYNKLSQASFKSYLNPQIVDQSAEQVEEWQQCCGYPGLRLLIPRAKKVQIIYREEVKDLQKKGELVDFQARVFLHQMDHIECIDPLKISNQIQICQASLNEQYGHKIQQLFRLMLQGRKNHSEQNIYFKSSQFNELKREITFTVTDHYRKALK